MEKLSKNAIRKLARYGVVPAVVKEFQDLEEQAFRHLDRHNYNIGQYNNLCPEEKHLKKDKCFSSWHHSKAYRTDGKLAIRYEKRDIPEKLVSTIRPVGRFKQVIA